MSHEGRIAKIYLLKALALLDNELGFYGCLILSRFALGSYFRLGRQLNLMSRK